MNICYLVTCSTETQTLENLLDRLCKFIDKDDSILILTDSYSLTEDTWGIIDKYLKLGVNKPEINHITHELNKDYSNHKNFGLTHYFCHKDFVFQIDGDELPTETLLINIKSIIESNPNIETFWIPRINDFKGVSNEHAKQWGWRLTTSATYNRPIVNWPDYQGRCFKKISDKIKWVGRLHERLEGNETFVYLPPDEDLALYHDKTIEKQIETNIRYNKYFTEKENKGFNLPK